MMAAANSAYGLAVKGEKYININAYEHIVNAKNDVRIELVAQGEIGLAVFRERAELNAAGGEIRQLNLSGDADHARVEMKASGVSFSGEYLSGYWANGSAFSIHIVSRDIASAGGLPDNLVFTAPGPQSIPLAVWFFCCAVSVFGWIGLSGRLEATYRVIYGPRLDYQA